MGFNLVLSGHDPEDHETDLCTNGGYSGLCDWLESLPTAEYPAARRLAEDGHYTPTDELAVQLNAAFLAYPPADPDTALVADRFLDLIGDSRPRETVAIVP